MPLVITDLTMPEKQRRFRVRKQLTFDPDLLKNLNRLAAERHESFSGVVENLLFFVVTLANLGMPLYKDGMLSWLKKIKELNIKDELRTKRTEFTDFNDTVRIKRRAKVDDQ